MAGQHMKYTLFRRRDKNGDEMEAGRSFVTLVWVILAFILILLRHSLGFFRWP